MRYLGFIGLFATATACTPITGANTGPDEGFLAELPEEVIALADPSQNLNAVTLDPVDNCYLYSYAGPVETTLLPLRTREGRPICLQRTAPATA